MLNEVTAVSDVEKVFNRPVYYVTSKGFLSTDGYFGKNNTIGCDMSGDPYPYLYDRSQTVPVLFNNSRTAMLHHNIEWLIEHQYLSRGLTGQFAIGGSDSRTLVAEMRYTYKPAIKKHMTSSLEIMQNQGHTFEFWGSAYSDALPDLSYYLGAIECQSGCTNQ